MTIRLRFIESTGEVRELSVEVGETALAAGLKAEIPELRSECGGVCTCAGCHVFVDPVWLPKLEPPTKLERGLLSLIEEVHPESRLCCQIKLTQDLDGLTLRTTPESV